MKRRLLTALALTAALALGACNTVAGAGKDLQSASEKTEDVINGR